MGHSRALFISFCPFNTVDSKQMFNIISPILTLGSLILEATALPTEPQPLPLNLLLLLKWLLFLLLVGVASVAVEVFTLLVQCLLFQLLVGVKAIFAAIIVVGAFTVAAAVVVISSACKCFNCCLILLLLLLLMLLVLNCPRVHLFLSQNDANQFREKKSFLGKSWQIYC